MGSEMQNFLIKLAATIIQLLFIGMIRKEKI